MEGTRAHRPPLQYEAGEKMKDRALLHQKRWNSLKGGLGWNCVLYPVSISHEISYALLRMKQQYQATLFRNPSGATVTSNLFWMLLSTWNSE
jgi:hypothetical protein